jgi:Uma2 family endonuclease
MAGYMADYGPYGYLLVGAMTVELLCLAIMEVDKWNIRVRPALRHKVRERVYRVPDVALLDFNVPRSPIAIHPPLAIFEILSPEDRYKHLLTRMADFARMGVEAIYVADPETGLFSRFQSGELSRVNEIIFPENAVGPRERTVPVEEIRLLVR